MDMKRLLLMMTLVPIMASAFTGEVLIDGFKYYIKTEAKTAEVRPNQYSGDIVIPDVVEYEGVLCNVTSIGEKAFYNCQNLESVIIGNNVISIGMNAFARCNIKSIDIPMSVKGVDAGAFEMCSALVSVSIPNSVAGISPYMFYHCYNLTSINIPNSVVLIAEHAFERCESLTAIDIPNSVGYIGKNAFDGCYGLATISIPNSVKTIDNYAFWHCNSLKKVSIGSGIETINWGAFADLELSDVFCHAENVPNTNYNAFVGSNISATVLHVPSVAMDSYRYTSPWCDFGSIVSSKGQCSSPIIQYVEGQLKLFCDTEGVDFITEIADEDIKTHKNSIINLSATYHISAYARKEGYEDSEIVYATLCWIDQEPNTEGLQNSVVQIGAVPVLIQNRSGQIVVTGLQEGTKISAYTISGTQITSTNTYNGQAIINTNLSAGSALIIKIGEKTMKVFVK